ncbi:hypothetical protein VPH35_011761 [Triticum aestivum]|uniref:Meg domain-containing protein n=1 Tax=Triticum turgidum subsp. durum TaxID=4567 RepID=A0A9R0R6M2_TRITD|nr:unnamed protein product [Triticum turgidum subsp. durum]
MDTYTIRILALALLSLYLVCSATVAQCRIIDDTDSEKIDLPNGLCVKSKCRSTPEDCFCCLADNNCYWTMAECKAACKKSSSSQDMLLATTTPPPLPAP